jgi:hypothetical protein
LGASTTLGSSFLPQATNTAAATVPKARVFNQERLLICVMKFPLMNEKKQGSL